jgi:hypothetical protein
LPEYPFRIFAHFEKSVCSLAKYIHQNQVDEGSEISVSIHSYQQHLYQNKRRKNSDERKEQFFFSSYKYPYIKKWGQQRCIRKTKWQCNRINKKVNENKREVFIYFHWLQLDNFRCKSIEPDQAKMQKQTIFFYLRLRATDSK